MTQLSNDGPVRLIPETLEKRLPILRVAGTDHAEYVTTPFVAFGFKQGEALPENMPGLRRRMVNCAGNVVSLQLNYHKTRKCYQLLAFGDFVKDEEATEWVYGVYWYSEDGKEWSNPTMMTRKTQDCARPAHVGCTVATMLTNADSGGNSVSKPFILPFDGERYDTRFPEPGYCRFLNAFFEDHTLCESKRANGKPDANNHFQFDLEWPERTVGNGMIPLPAVKQRYEIVRYENNGEPCVFVRGALIVDLFADRAQVWHTAVGRCLDPELLAKDGLGSWEFRIYKKKQLKAINQIKLGDIAEALPKLIDEAGEDEDSESSATLNAELEAATTAEA